tara:strand:+ start:352 stop:570 length:219 start_codon:yes stop_codon:yes gene_type:complete
MFPGLFGSIKTVLGIPAIQPAAGGDTGHPVPVGNVRVGGVEMDGHADIGTREDRPSWRTGDQGQVAPQKLRM